jgi:DNA repair photolyase
MVISASRRSDIPAFYINWFMERIMAGSFVVINPYNQKKKRVDATPENIHTIVFWSKDYSRFIQGRYGERLKKIGYNLFFNFTINSESKRLEPKVPPLSERIEQLKYLCEHFGAQTINWRFDPICFFEYPNGQKGNNLSDFSKIADAASKTSIKRCITSFMDIYGKIEKRLAETDGFTFVEPSMNQKKGIIIEMKHILESKKIQLLLCCEKKLLKQLSIDGSVTSSSCVPNHLFTDMFGSGISLRNDTGQRVKEGCGCGVSVDIGSYREHPCYHNCLFCYANPTDDSPPRKED